MKKFLAMLLALAMVFSLAACSGGNDGKTNPDTSNPNNIDDNPTTSDGKYEIAMITDEGQLKDGSFNECTWNGVKLYAAQNNKTYKYYQPANGNEATDEDRYDAYQAAVEGGAKVIVAPGYMQEVAMRRSASENPDVSYIFIDGYSLNDDNGNLLTNVAGIAFQEEQCGYLAGYAIVKEGFTKLGFSGGGGGTVPSCCRYGYGYVQGANAAAADMGVQVEMRYSWQNGATFSASDALQNQMQGWYETGTEIVFACGGTMFNSISAAAAAAEQYVVGVDVDQSGQSDTVVTSAMKDLIQSVNITLNAFYNNKFDDFGGKSTSLGAKDDAVALPTDTWSMEKFSVADYEKLLAGIKDGSLSVDADYESGLEQAWSNLTLTIE